MNNLTAYLKYRKLLFGLLSAGAVWYLLNFFGPIQALPSCMVKAYTGFNCLACGTTTASFEILNHGFDSQNINHYKVLIAGIAVVLFLGYDFIAYSLKLKKISS